ncbi:hypothetical protein BDW60DRAFT_209310 [Aspergillus nidulans var. acristatus]
MSFFDVVLRIRETRDFELKLQKLLSTLLIHLPCTFGGRDVLPSDMVFFWDLDHTDNALMENIAWLSIASGLVMLEDLCIYRALLRTILEELRHDDEAIQLLDLEHRDGIIRYVLHCALSPTDRFPAFMVPTAGLPSSLYPPICPVRSSPRISRWVEFLVEDAYEGDLDVSSATSLKRGPTTEMEICLRSLWARALRLTRSATIGADHDFRLGAIPLRRHRHLPVSSPEWDGPATVMAASESVCEEYRHFSTLNKSKGKGEGK